MLKMATNASEAFTECLEELSDLPQWETRCRFVPTMYIMKEILLLQQLKHPNILNLLGFCVQGDDINSMSLQEHGVIAVYEYGDKVKISDMRLWPLSRRLDTAIQLLDLAVYAEHSPMGSIRLMDMKRDNFLFVGSMIKFSDMDLLTNMDPECSDVEPDRGCSFNLPCIGGRCRGFNAKYNLMRMSKVFLMRLLRSTISDEEKINKPNTTLNSINKGLESVRSDLNDILSSSSTDIYDKLIKIRKMI